MPTGRAEPISCEADQTACEADRGACEADRVGRPEVVDLPGLEGVACPCGTARRAFAGRDDFPATVHWTEISTTARTHYHRRLTETYVIVQCAPDAAMELDGVVHPVQPGTAVLIPPGVRHRAVGEMRVVIFCTPKFDPTDEHFD